MTTCPEITASRASRYPVELPRHDPTETDRIESDVSLDVDCAGAGITITQSTWTIEPLDDDGALTLGAAFVSGLVTYQPYSAGTPDKTYTLYNDVTTSDGLVLRFTFLVTVMATVRIAFGG